MKDSETFWGGKRNDEIKALEVEVPFDGKVRDKKRPMLEEFRKFVNVYYRYYNDGDAFSNRLRYMAKRHGVVLKGWSDESLEQLGDKVVDAAVAEQVAAS